MRHPDYADEIKRALTSPAELCHALGFSKDYKPQAGGGIIVLCPAHKEKSPSCSVSIGTEGTIRVHCFGCHFTTDASASLMSWSRGPLTSHPLRLRRPVPACVSRWVVACSRRSCGTTNASPWS